MPLTFEQKQEQFINELVLDFKDSIKKLNDEIRNRSDARAGFVQSTANVVFGATSNAGTIGSVTSTATSFIFNRAKSNKQAQRRECINAEVMTHLHDKIHDEIKKVLSQKFLKALGEFFLDVIKPPADKTVQRWLNYQTVDVDFF